MKAQQFLSISYNPVYRVTKSEQFLTISYFSVHKTSIGFTNFLHPYLSNQNLSPVFYNFLQPSLSDHKNPAVFIIYLQLHLSVCKTSLCQFLTPLRTLQSLLISYNPIYLVTNALELRSSFNNPIIILKNFIRLHQFLTPLLIGPKSTCQTTKTQQSLSIFYNPTYRVTKNE